MEGEDRKEEGREGEDTTADIRQVRGGHEGGVLERPPTTCKQTKQKTNL